MKVVYVWGGGGGFLLSPSGSSYLLFIAGLEDIIDQGKHH